MIEIAGNGSLFNADDNGLVTGTCRCGYVVRSRERVPGEVISAIDLREKDGELRIFYCGFEVPPDGLKCNGCGEWVWKVTQVDDSQESDRTK